MERFDEFESAVEAARILHREGFEAYLVGGAVRDIWLGREPKDFDLVTNATPEQVMRIAEFADSKYKDTTQAYGVTRANFRNQGAEYELEIATFRRDIEAYLGRKETKVEFATLEDDVLRRDFTINALAFDLYTNQIIDFVDGIADLEDKLIRFIGEPEDRIKEDPLRIMRAIRFKNHLGFSYHGETSQAIKNAVKSGYVEKIATDRMRIELTKLLTHPSRRQSVYDLYKFGILARVLPEVTAGIGIKQPPEFHSEGDVWQHELIILDHLPAHPGKRLAWAALLHDIGKAATVTMPQSSKDRIHFNRHYEVGAEMAANILNRLRFSKKEIANIVWVIQNHMTIDDLPEMRPSHQQRMLGHPAFEDLFELHRADSAASWPPEYPRTAEPAFPEIEELWKDFQSTPPEIRRPSLKRDLNIDGDWILENFAKEFSLKPSPIIGDTLEELKEYYKDTGDKQPESYLRKAREILNPKR